MKTKILIIICVVFFTQNHTLVFAEIIKYQEQVKVYQIVLKDKESFFSFREEKIKQEDEFFKKVNWFPLSYEKEVWEERIFLLLEKDRKTIF